MKLMIVLFLLMSFAHAQEQGTSLAQIQKTVNDTLASRWYEKIQLKGYAQFRYNRLLETNKDLTCSICDKSVGDKQGFFLRRARLVLFGEVHERVYVYIQPDFASDAATASSAGTASTQQNYFNIRDAYFEYALTTEKEWRIRSGISKVPFGWENLQSSSNRTAFDRTDAINSAVPNERDIGMFLMYSPPEMRKRFKDLTSNNLKGTGDYGMFAIGAYNGQTLNRPEKNNDLHRVVRFTYPHQFAGGQFVEASVHAFEGKFTASDNNDYYDARRGASFIVYPQPLGFQLEYNQGQGPEYDPSVNSIKSKDLRGGYALVNYQHQFGSHRLMPYLRYQEYEGGKKLESGAPANDVREWELGNEWQPNPAFELTVAYALSDRETQSNLTNRSHEKGQLLRLQAQFNY